MPQTTATSESSKSSLMEDVPRIKTKRAKASRQEAFQKVLKTEKKKPKKAEKKKKLPVTLLSGFLGAGKTTLLKHLLQSNEHKKKIAVIVNDMAELNIDSKFIDKSGFVQTKAEIVSLQNGCICCTLRTDLIREINNIQQMGTFDYLIIESTGIAEPMQVAESFVFDPTTLEVTENESEMLWEVAELDTCVSVVDASQFPSIVRSLETAGKAFPTEFDDDSNPSNSGEGSKHIAQLLIEQVEFANIILLNKIDLLNSNEKKRDAITLLKALNPSARIIESSFGRIDPAAIMNTGLFDMKTMSASPGWLQSLTSDSAGESDEYGISSFVYRARKPFHPERLSSILNSLFVFSNDLDIKKRKREATSTSNNEEESSNCDRFGSILRSKGFCWIAGRDQYAAEWNQNGKILSLSPSTEWFCTQPEESWEVEDKNAVKRDFEGPYGDRRQEIVFIGTALNQAGLSGALDACLLDDNEMSSHDSSILLAEGGAPLFFGNLNTFVDPLPVWADVISETGLWTKSLRQNQSQEFELEPGVSLKFQHVALDFPLALRASAHSFAVKVWMDSAQGLSTLLCTLQPVNCEQYNLNFMIPATKASTEEDYSPYFLLRLEIIQAPSSECSPTYTDAIGNICVYVSALATQEKLQNDEEEEQGEDEDAHQHSH